LHAKSTLIDNQLLIIGSQNMHYSSWGENALTEYGLTTDDPAAIQEYQALFETKWQEAVPFEEAKYGTSP
jgi:cardiolipin synthase